MTSFRYGRVGLFVGLGAIVTTAMCSQEFDTTRTPAPQGTVGAEVFHIVCERVDVGESPGDIDFSVARPVCTGAVSADAGTAAFGMVGPKVRAMGMRRPGLVDAIDRMFPASTPRFPDFYASLDDFLWNLLPLYGPENGRDGGVVHLMDGGTAPSEDLLPQTTRSLTILLDGMANDAATTSALSRISWHQGYRPPQTALGLTRALLGSSTISAVMDNLLAQIRAPSPNAPTGPSYPHFATVLDVLRGELANSGPASTADQQNGTDIDVTVDLLFRTDPGLSTSKPRLLVRRDPYGMAQIALDGSGNFPAPFVDTTPADGFADSVNGHYVDASRRPFAVAPPFPANEALTGPRDMQNRALAAPNGAPLYQYVDLDQSVLGALLHDTHTLVDPANNIALGFMNGASVLFGSRAMAMHDYGLQHPCGEGMPMPLCNVPAVRYNSFDPTTTAPLLDTAHAVGTMLSSPDIDTVLQLAQALMVQNEAPLARSMGAMLAINDSANSHPEATIDPRSMIWDDVIDVARHISQVPGLLEDIIQATSDPATPGLGHAFAQLAANRDRVEPDWSSQSSQNQTLAGQTLHQPVSRQSPDTIDFTEDTSNGNLTVGQNDNRSVFERFLHLLNDLNGVQLCNKQDAELKISIFGVTWTYPTPLNPGHYAQCSLIQIPDAAVFYVQAIAGTAQLQFNPPDAFLGFVTGLGGTGTLDWVIENQSGITGFNTHPTPEAINRFVFQPDSLRTAFTQAMLDPVQTKDGFDVRTVHPGTLFAVEMYDMLANLRPLARAFVNHNAEHLFVELLAAVHRHYPSANAGQFQTTDPTAPFYNTMDGAVRYEPILVDAFDGDLLSATQQLTSALPSIDVGGGRTGVDGAAILGRMLLEPSSIPMLSYRDGRTTTVRQDGVTPVNNPSVYYLFADAFNEMDPIFASNAAQHMDWVNARSHLVDTFLSVDGAGTPNAQFHNRRIPLVTNLAVQWLRDRIAAHVALGDQGTWARGLSGRLGTTVQGPSFGSIYDLLLDLYHDTGTRNAVGSLLMDLLDDSGSDPNNHLGVAMTALGDTVQTLRDDTDLDPLLHALAPAFQRSVPTPQGLNTREELIPTLLRFLERSRDYDTDRVMDTVLQNAVSRPSAPLLADEPIVVIGDAIAETHRVQPGAGGPLSAADIQSVLTNVSQFLSDGSRGMEQFYYVVQHRRYH